MQTLYAERFKLSDEQEWIRDLLKLCKLHEVGNVTVENVVKTWVKDAIAAQLVSSL